MYEVHTVQVWSHDTDTDTGTGADAWVGEILPAPSCYVFTMVLVDRGYVDMCLGRVATRVYCRPIDGNIRFI